MIFWIIGASVAFRTVYNLIGARELVNALLMAVPFGRWGVIIVMQVILLILGCFLDPWGILMIVIPVFAPIVTSLGFNLVWFGILFVINMEMGYLTPPVGLNIFYLKGVVPKEVTMSDIYRSVLPFVLIQGIGLALIMLFPKIVMLIPDLVFN